MDVNVKGGLAARVVNLVLGVWLFVSAFAWTHGKAQMTNTWILGVLAVIFALIATRVPKASYLNTALAVWLFISAFALPRMHQGTAWNNVLVAIVMFFVSLQLPDEPARHRLAPQQTHAA